jgi:hypothetical protein
MIQATINKDKPLVVFRVEFFGLRTTISHKKANQSFVSAFTYPFPQDKVEVFASLARERGAGLIHITDAVLSNPYNKISVDNLGG